ncbi:MAG: hypothetical protein ACYDCL_03895 [Myxococcales bacterium]
MRSVTLILASAAALAACSPTNGLSGSLAFDVEGSGALVEQDGGAPWNAHVYLWGSVADGGSGLTTVCGEVTPTGPVSSAIVPNLVALNLLGGPSGLVPGSFAVGGDGGSDSATAIVSLGADGNEPQQVWLGVSGSVTLSSVDASQLAGGFQLQLQPIAGTPDAGSLSGSFAASLCQP